MSGEGLYQQQAF